MGQKSSIDALPKPVKDRIGSLIQENRLTLDQILDELERDFGTDKKPSRTALHRHKAKYSKVIAAINDKRDFSVMLVNELGVRPESDQGRMLVEMMHCLLTDSVVSHIQEGKPLDPATLKELAQALKAVSESGRINLHAADMIEKRAREKLVREQQAQLAGMKKDGIISAETLKTIRERVYGILPKAVGDGT